MLTIYYSWTWRPLWFLAIKRGEIHRHWWAWSRTHLSGIHVKRIPKSQGKMAMTTAHLFLGSPWQWPWHSLVSLISHRPLEYRTLRSLQTQVCVILLVTSFSSPRMTLHPSWSWHWSLFSFSKYSSVWHFYLASSFMYENTCYFFIRYQLAVTKHVLFPIPFRVWP